MFELYPHQLEAISKLKNGSLLVGGTGSGKSYVGLGYFYKVIGGSLSPLSPPVLNTPLYVITTANKRNTNDWQTSALNFGISVDESLSVNGIRFVVDSWNNIQKYVNVTGAMFIFDEQKVTNYGRWSKTFVKIARKNHWILMSATPADRWKDIAPVFVANNMYKNMSEFMYEHVVYDNQSRYPKIRMYIGTEILERRLQSILVPMSTPQKANEVVLEIFVDHDTALLAEVQKTRWNIFKNEPSRSRPEHEHVIRKILYSHPSRLEAVKFVLGNVKKLIIFYHYNYELEMLRSLSEITTVSEYNGHSHDDVPTTDEWAYLVQYTSGSEAWECFTTNHTLYFSLNYSYRVMRQCMGRTNRLTTTYSDVYHYQLVSHHWLDKAVSACLKRKKDFSSNLFNARVSQRL
jgi:hypothetical protein